ncbi:hypothetical protein [Methylorubrum thiocyanatum]|uniref:hypothetical protein n=1 Tax=Methylorubrum thiocyanatum TaxID=47958 RepID=UPI003F81D3CF
MSRHILVDRPDCQVVIGFDHMLRSFFGQVFDPSNRRRRDTPVAGWPTGSGLGTRRPPRLCAERDLDVRLLIEWARDQQPDGVWNDPDAAVHLARLRSAIRFEWEEGLDYAELPVPAVLREALS